MEEVKSPCNDRCIIDVETGLCIGCLRTSEEIAQWGELSNDQKMSVLAEVETRKEKS